MIRKGVLTLLMLAGAGSAARAADWPQWLGPARNGTTSETVFAWTTAPKVVWRQEVNKGNSSPVVSNGVAVAHTAVKGKDAEDVRAYDAQTGDPLWSDSYPRAPFRSQLSVSPQTTPAIFDGRLYTYGITGILSCYELKTGKRLWQTNPLETLKTTPPGFGVCSSPVVVDGVVIVLVGGTGAVAAYDAVTGDFKWKSLDEPAGLASPTVLVRKEGGIERTDVVVQTTLRLAGLSPQDGKVRWEHPLVFQPQGVSPTPVALGQTLVCTAPDTGTMVLEFSGDSPAPKSNWWKQDLRSYFSTGAAGRNGTTLVVTNLEMPPRADLRCLDLAKGDELWKKEGLGYYHMGPIVTGDGKLLILDDGGNLLLAEGSREGFKELAKAKICRGAFCNPAVASGRLYVRDDRELICLDLGASVAANP